MASGSKAVVVTHFPAPIETLRASFADLENTAVDLVEGDTTDRDTLASIMSQGYRRVIVLAQRGDCSIQVADGRTLVTLFHLRDLADEAKADWTIVSEMLDERNRVVAEAARADDFIVTEALVSKILTQIAESPMVSTIFSDLLDADGAEIYLKLASNYVALERPVSFATIVEAAKRRNEVAIGYRVKADAQNPAADWGVVINPPKDRKVTLRQWDRLVVVAQD